MIFTVVWLPSALSRLTDIWILAPDRQAVADAANAIDRALRVDAHKQGQPFFGGRILLGLPLAVTYEVSMNDCMVTVVLVERIRP